MAARALPYFFGLPAEFRDPARSLFRVIPLPYERTTSFGQGTRRGPAAIYEASCQVELLDENHLDRAMEVGVIDDLLPYRKLGSKAQYPALEKLAQGAVERCLEAGQIPIGLGGEHTVSVPIIRALARRYTDLTVVSIDAHADLRDRYEGTPYSHACAMRRAMEVAHPVVVGVRSLCEEEATWIERHGLLVLKDREIERRPEVLDLVAQSVSGRDFYLTIDADGLSTALVPEVGTPEPGGLTWYRLLDFLEKLLAQGNLVGFDVVELAPPKTGLAVGPFTLAKLIYKIIGIHARKLGRIKPIL